MPVLFRGRSEYARNYKWNESFRSASFVPRTSQTAEDAGLRSDQLGAFQEPRIAGKKKAWHRDPQVQSCLIWWPDSDSESKTKLERRKSDPSQQPSPIVIAEKKRKASHRESSSTRKQPKEGLKSNKLNVPTPKIDDMSEMHNKETTQSTPEKKTQRENLDGSYKKVSPHKSKDRKVKSITSKGDNEQASPKTKQATPSKRSKKGSKYERKMEDEQSAPSQSSKNIVLQRKAGLHETKPRVSRARLSEYQQKFAPPKLVQKSSPVISAADIVHSSSPAIPPHSGIKFRPTTEYVASYKQKESPLVKSPSKTLSSPASPSMKARIRDVQNPYFTNAKKKSMRSEYASQFEANDEFQLGELRKMAETNKQKHIGTHIDPHHLTQVASPYNSCWEASSHGSGDEKTGSPETVERMTEKDEEKWSQASQVGSSTSATLEAEKETAIDTDSLEDDVSITDRDSVTRKLAWTEENGTEDNSGISPDAESVLEGRVTTPRLQEMGGARRTHLDLTTPAKGGALLISPSAAGSMESSVYSEQTKNRASPMAGVPTHDAQDLIKNRSHTLIRAGGSQKPIAYTIDKRQNQTPTKKPLVVRESPKSTPLKTFGTPTVNSHAPVMKNARAPIRGALRSEEFQHCGPTGKPHTAPAKLVYDEADALSVASSLTSARASELLSRAQQRKRFWATTS